MISSSDGKYCLFIRNYSQVGDGNYTVNVLFIKCAAESALVLHTERKILTLSSLFSLTQLEKSPTEELTIVLFAWRVNCSPLMSASDSQLNRVVLSAEQEG